MGVNLHRIACLILCLVGVAAVYATETETEAVDDGACKIPLPVVLDPSDVGVVWVVSTEGVNKMFATLVPVFENLLLDAKLTDFHTTLDLDITKVNLDITENHFTDLYVGSLVASTDHANNLMEFSISDMRGVLAFDWAFQETSFPFLSDSGTGTATATGITGQVLMGPDFNDECGVMAVSIDQFDFELNDLDIHLDGGHSALYNVIIGALVDVMEGAFVDVMDAFIANGLMDTINRGFANLSQNQWLRDGIRENYQFVSPGFIVLDQYVSVHMSGYAYPEEIGPTWSGHATLMPGPMTDQINNADLQYEMSNTVFESVLLAGMSLDLMK
ncbi:hypothetical protein KIPB_007246, partial [Kipferlia bialata]|eukprot:g7246.t1